MINKFSRFAFLSLPRNRAIVLAVTVIGIQRVLQIIGTFITLPLILHAVGVAEFGIWGAATSLTWLGSLLDLGLQGALIALVVEGLAKQDFIQVRDHITVGVLGATCMAVVVFILGTAFVCFVETGTERAAFLIAVAGLGATIPLSLANNVWIGLQKSYIAAVWDITQTIFMISGVLWVVFTHSGALALVTVFYGSIVLAYALSTAHLMLNYPQFRPQKLILPTAIWRQVLAKGSMLTAIGIALGFSYALDNVLTLKFLGPIASAQMAIVLRICIFATSIISALTQPVWPAFVDAHNKGEHQWSRRMLVWGTASIVLICVTGGGVLVMFGQSLLRMWLHNDLEIGTPLFLAIAFWIFVMSVPRIAGWLLNALSIFQFQLKIMVVTSAVALTIKYFCAVRFGVMGILLATPLCALIICWPAFMWRLSKWWSQDKILLQ